MYTEDIVPIINTDLIIRKDEPISNRVRVLEDHQAEVENVAKNLYRGLSGLHRLHGIDAENIAQQVVEQFFK